MIFDHLIESDGGVGDGGAEGGVGVEVGEVRSGIDLCGRKLIHHSKATDRYIAWAPFSSSPYVLVAAKYSDNAMSDVALLFAEFGSLLYCWERETLLLC